MAIVHRVTVTNRNTGELLESKDFQNRVSADMYADELDRKYARTAFVVLIAVESIQT